MDGPKETAPKKKGGSARTGSGKTNRIKPEALRKSLIEFGEDYQIGGEQDFLETVRQYVDESALIQRMRDQIETEGLMITRTTRAGGEEPITHPLLSELPKHVACANGCLSTIADLILKRGARVEKATRALDAFRLH